jgi:hypothetical protein
MTALARRLYSRTFTPPRGRPDRRRTAGQRATPEARAMVQGYTPSGIAAHSVPSGADRQDKPRIQLEESVSGFRYKQTDSDAHRGSPQGGEAADRGLDCHVQPRGTGSRQQVAPTCPQDSMYAAVHPPRPRPATQRTRPGSSSSRRRGNLRFGRWPGSLLPGIAAHSASSGAVNSIGTTWLDARLSRPGPAINWPQSAQRRGRTRGQCGPHCTTDSDGTCQLPAANTRHGSARSRTGSDLLKNVPGDDPPPGPGATSECCNSRQDRAPRPGQQVRRHHRDRRSRTVTT